MQNKNLGKGFFCGILAAVTYGMNPLFTLPLYRDGMTADSVLFYRYALAAVLLGAVMKFNGAGFRLARREILPVAAGGVLMALSSLTLFLSFLKMEAGIACTILFIYPVMVAVMMAVFFREKITASTVLSIALALAGIAILYRGGAGGALNFWGVVLVLLSALTYALYMVGIKVTAMKEMAADRLAFYSLVFGLPVFLIRLDWGMAIQPVPFGFDWLLVLALALLPTVVSLYAIAIAIRFIGATRTAILGALEPATAIFWGVLLFGEHLTVRLMLGVLLILAAVLLILSGRDPVGALRNVFHKKQRTR